MNVARDSWTPYASRAVAQVGSWPGVRSTSAECGLGVGLSVDARQVVHLHADGTAELFLTWPVIGRLSKALTDCGRVQMEPGGDWVRMRLESDSDVALLISLASVAIKAITSDRGGWTAPCLPATARLGATGGMSRRLAAVKPTALRERRHRRPRKP